MPVIIVIHYRLARVDAMRYCRASCHLRWFSYVIPGRRHEPVIRLSKLAARGEPGIHNPDLWLWIPGRELARVPEDGTIVRVTNFSDLEETPMRRRA